MFVQHPADRLLRRGQILLIGGGAAVVISLAMMGYYALKLDEALVDERHKVEPNSSVTISRNITTTGQGAYSASLMGLAPAASPTVAIHGPTGSLVLERAVDQLVVMETFAIIEVGIYNLTLTNPSPDTALEAGIILDSQEALLNRIAISPVIAGLFSILLLAGAGAAVAGTAILIMDKRRLSKMKKFGDMSDLV